MRPLGRSLELHFIDGKPDGMLTAEVFNWTGHVLVIPRIRLKDGLARAECGYTGVYILLGEKDGDTAAYIGEGEDIRQRIKNHAQSKDWWNQAVIVTSTGNNLHKAHVKYLESRLVEEARRIGRTELDNLNTPPKPSLSEAAIANMEGFIDYLMMVLPAIRVDTFVERVRKASVQSDVDAQPNAVAQFLLDYPSQGLKAKAILKDGEFVVLAGSQARLKWQGHEGTAVTYEKLHHELIQAGVLKPENGHSVFVENCAFTSPSAAAAVIYGRSASGPISWKTPNGQLFRDWEALQLGGESEAETVISPEGLE